MILNLKDINQFIQPVHFRMETLAAILPMLKRVDWAVIGSTKKCLYSASVREREEDERDGARVDAGGVPRGRQVGAASFSVAFGSVCARVARGLAQVRKADGWFLQM